MFSGKWKMALETAMIVLLIIALKFAVARFGFEIVEFNTLLSSIIAGGVFLIGMILAGTLSDYKECDRIPAEMVSTLESIYEEGVQTQRRYPTFHLAELREALLAVVAAFRYDLEHVEARTTLGALNQLSDSFAEMEDLGVPANYIVRMKTEQATLRKQVLRVYHIQRTDFVPSAYILVDTIIGLIITLLVLVEVKTMDISMVTSLLVLGFLSYLFIYMLKLLRTLDRPFRPHEDTMDDVSRFLFKEYQSRLEADRQADTGTPAGQLPASVG